jgi:nucleoside-diphosphate-sugar epimerase
MKIAITGATGFVGGFIANSLESNGYDVVRFGRKKQINIIQWDISKEIHNPIETYDVVIHCAALVDDWSSYSDLFDVNVIGTKNVIQSFSDTKSIIYISTGSVYSSMCNLEKISEDQCVGGSTLSPYGKTKLLGEKEIEKSLISSRIILRPHIIYGAEGNVVTQRIKDSIKNNTFFLPGNGQNNLCFTHIENLLHAVERCIEKQPQGIHKYNIVDRENETIEKVLLSVRELNGLNFKIKKIPKNISLFLGYVSQFIYKLLGINKPPKLTPYILRQMTHNQILDISAAEKYLDYRPLKNYKNDFYLPK